MSEEFTPIGEMLPQEVEMELARLRRERAELVAKVEQLRNQVTALIEAQRAFGKTLGLTYNPRDVELSEAR